MRASTAGEHCRLRHSRSARSRAARWTPAAERLQGGSASHLPVVLTVLVWACRSPAYPCSALPEGVPFHGFAERLGAAVLPGTEAARKAERQAKLAACKARTGQRW